MRLLYGKKKISSFQIIILGFASVILAGSLLLMLPWATAEPGGAPFLDALFTATSAVCVTGLIIYDTATYWSVFGQAVIILLIQIGGMGVVTVAVATFMFSGRKISLAQRSTMQEAISAPQMGGIVKLTGFILRATLLIEFLGALIMSVVFCRDFGFWKGIWYSLFHSISAFCNAGFDLIGVREPFSSLTSYAANPIINFVIMGLIIVGGIGFLTWDDICIHKFHLKKYRMQSKVILTVTTILIILPAVFFYAVEFSQEQWSDMGQGERILSSLFQSVTPRTAGFNTVDLTKLSEASIAVMMILMLIGGSPGSTAGGMKTTTVAVLFASAIAVFRRRKETDCFKRRISEDIVNRAAAIMLMYITLFVGGGILISCLEDLPLMYTLYETASAIGTVGLSLGITGELGSVSHIVLILLMFFGRVGGLTLIYAAISGTRASLSKLPQEKITVG